MMQQTQQEEQEELNTWQSAPQTQAVEAEEADTQSTESSEQNLAQTKATIHQYLIQAAGRGLARYFSGLLLCFMGLMAVACWLVGSAAFHLATIVLVLFLPLFFCMFALRQEAKARSLMEQIEDIRLIGPLAQLLDAETSARQPSVAAALRRLLPNLKASDAHLLTKEQRACLYRLLSRGRFNSWNYDKELILAILKSLEQIGDKDALPAVQKLAKWSSDKGIRDAANDCMGYLFEKSEEHLRGATYLRPADARTSGPDVLLRASTSATEHQQTPPDQLLRANQQE